MARSFSLELYSSLVHRDDRAFRLAKETRIYDLWPWRGTHSVATFSLCTLVGFKALVLASCGLASRKQSAKSNYLASFHVHVWPFAPVCSSCLFSL